MRLSGRHCVPTRFLGASIIILVAVGLVLGGCQQVTLPNPFRSAQEDRAANKPAPAVAPSVPLKTAPQEAAPLVPPSEPAAETEAPEQVILTPPFAQGQHTRVGFLAPLSGQQAATGQALLDAAQLGLFDVADNEFELLPYDTEGTPAGARVAAERALADGVRLILGPLFAASVTEVAPLAQARGINVVAFSNNRVVAGNGATLVGLLPGEQVHRVVGYARARGLGRFAALVPDTPFGQAVLRDFQEAVAVTGGDLVKVEVYAGNETDFNQVVRRLADFEPRRNALLERRRELTGRNDDGARLELQRLERSETLGDTSFDAIFIPAAGRELRSIAALLPFYDIDTKKIRLLGTAQWNEPGIGREPALVGAWFAGPDPGARADLDRRFKATYGYDAPGLAPIVYDATAVAAVLARSGGDDPFATAALTAPNGFAGTAGIFRFLPAGLPQRRLAVMQVEPWSIRVISPAGTTFADLAN